MLHCRPIVADICCFSVIAHPGMTGRRPPRQRAPIAGRSSPSGRSSVTNGGGASRMAGSSRAGAVVEDIELTLSEPDIEAPLVRLTLGEQQLSIPVEMELDGRVRRFTLSIRLDLRESETGP